MLDLSNNNSRSWLPLGYNFRRAYDAGQRRVYFKATQGSRFVDKRTPALAARAEKAGFLIGWYAFADDWWQKPHEQAAFFVKTMPKLYDLIPCLDMEQGAPSRAKGLWALGFAAAVSELTGEETMIYGSTYYLKTCFQGISVTHSPLWLAAVARDGGPLDYKHAEIPSPWLPKQVAFHQYNWHARVPGIPGEVDLSRPINANLANVRAV